MAGGGAPFATHVVGTSPTTLTFAVRPNDGLPPGVSLYGGFPPGRRSMVESAAPVALYVSVTVGGTSVEPPDAEPGKERVTTKFAWLIDQPLPGGLSDSLTNDALVGSGRRMKMLWMLFTVTPLSDVGTTIGFTATVKVALLPRSTLAGPVVTNVMSWSAFWTPYDPALA